MAKIFARRGCRRGPNSIGGRRRAQPKKNRVSQGKRVDYLRLRHFFEKKTGGGVFYVGPSRISGSGLRVRAAVGKIMLHKVPWALGEVS